MANFSQTSSTSSRADHLEYFKQQFGLDDAHAALLLRAERLQEKGQVDQALMYFQAVLRVYPGCSEARMNVDMILRARQDSSSASRHAVPHDAKLSCELYGGVGGDIMERQPDGRSRFIQWCDAEGCSESAPLFLTREQSDTMWKQIIDVVEDGSGMYTCDPTNYGEDFPQVGTQISVTLNGENKTYYSNGESPVARIMQRFVQMRQREVDSW